MIPNSRSLRFKFADLESQVLEAQKAAFQKKLQTMTKEKQVDSNVAQISLKKARTAEIFWPKLNFDLFYKHQGKEF